MACMKEFEKFARHDKTLKCLPCKTDGRTGVITQIMLLIQINHHRTADNFCNNLHNHNSMTRRCDSPSSEMFNQTTRAETGWSVLIIMCVHWDQGTSRNLDTLHNSTLFMSQQITVSSWQKQGLHALASFFTCEVVCVRYSESLTTVAAGRIRLSLS